MAETLASTLNQPLDPFSIVGQVSKRSGLIERGTAARNALEPMMRAEEASQSEARRLEREGAEQVAQKNIDLAQEEVRGIQRGQAQFEQTVGQPPVRKVQDFNPNAGMELAALTAIVGAFVGVTGGGGRGALAALQGATEGYRLGDQDRYERGIKDYEAELQSYKNRFTAAKQTLDNWYKLEAAKKGSGAAEAKKLEAQIAGTVGEAQAKAKNYGEVNKFLADAMKSADQAQKTLLTATATAKRKEEREGVEMAAGIVPPPYTPTIQVHSSGIPLAPINPYVNVSPEDRKSIMDANQKDAANTFKQIRLEDDKNATKEASMDIAEAALRRMVIKAFELGKKEGRYPKDAVLDTNTMTVKGGNLPQVTGGVYGLPLIGEFFQQILTSKDPDASLFKTQAANYQRGSYVPGEGQISNFERQLFAQAAIDIGRPPLTNFELIRATREAAKRQRDRKQFYEEYYAVNRTLQGAEQFWRLYSEANKFTEIDQFGNVRYKQGIPDYRTWFRSQQGRDISEIKPQQQFRSEPSITPQRITNQQEYDALPSGSLYIDSETNQLAKKP